ncbi:MAG: hypothetical protein JXA30_01615 [Deltaproteobacteria bacterium]|nr:hypothetical protein [Deltaproteobacteria bacterium]
MAGSWALVARPAVGKARATDRSEALRVLFIGNSYTNFNMLPALVTRLAQSGNDVSAIQATAFTKPGYSLRMHWKRHRALRIIKTGHFSHIVLQSHSLDPIDRPEQLKQYVDRFVRAIEETGAQAVLYETWARHPRSSIYRNRPTLSSPDEMYRRIDEIFRIAAQRSRARLAPVGLAFRRMFDEHPDIDLHRADGSHPSWSGSFLAACVIYGVLTGNSPMTTSYHPFEVTPFQAGKLKQMAAQAIAQSANSDAFQSVF